MKCKILLIVLILALFLTAGCSNQATSSGKMDAVSCRTISFSNGNFEDITVIVNQSDISNYQECAEEIIQRVLNNDFQTILFSFDERGYPIGLSANVYLTEADWKNGNYLFHMEYTQDTTCNYIYDMYNNPEMFTLIIEE